MSTPSDEGYIIEFQRVGSAVKVTAVDPQSGVEVSIVGDARAGEAVLSRAALQKLRYVLERRSGAAKPPGPSGSGGRGQVV
jgi:hypothetical protein